MAKLVKCNILCLENNLHSLTGTNHSNVRRISEETLSTVCINPQTQILPGYTLITLSSVERVEYQSPTKSEDNQSPTLKAALKIIPSCLEYNHIIQNHVIYLVIEEPYHNSLEKGLLDQWMRQTLTAISVGKVNHKYYIVQIVGGNIGVQNAAIDLLDHLRLNFFNSSN